MNFLILAYIIFQILDLFSLNRILLFVGIPVEYGGFAWFSYLLVVLIGICINFKSIFKNTLKLFSTLYLTAFACIYLISSILNGFSDVSLFIFIKQSISLIFPFLAASFFFDALISSKIFRKFIIALPILNLLSFLANLLASISLGFDPVNSSTLVLLSLYLSYKSKNKISLLISSLVLILSFKKSILLAFSVVIFVIFYSLLKTNIPIILNKFLLQKKFLILSLIILVVLPSIYFGLASGRNSHIVDTLSNLFNYKDLIFEGDINSTSHPLFFPFYVFTSGRSTEYLTYIQKFINSAPWSIFFGMGVNESLILTDIYNEEYFISGIHSAFLQVIYCTGFLGLSIYSMQLYNLTKNCSFESKLLLLSWLIFGLFNGINFDGFFAISIALICLEKSKFKYFE